MTSALPPVLVIDDEKNMRLSLKTLLADEGYDARTVESAEEALPLLTQEDFLMVITDARLGLSAVTVRITAVEEDEEGTLSITAEDFFGGYSTAVLYPKQLGAGYIPNWNSPPGDVNPPIIFEPPPALLTGGVEIWVALSGVPIGVELRSGSPVMATPTPSPGL